DITGQLITISVDDTRLSDLETSRRLAACGPAYALIIPTDDPTAPPAWCTGIRTEGRTPTAVAAEIINDAANKHAVELDAMKSTRTGATSTGMMVVIALAAALLLFGCAALFVGIPINRASNDGPEILRERGFAVEEPRTAVEPVAPPMPPPAEVPPADEYQPAVELGETGPEVLERLHDLAGPEMEGPAVLVGTVQTRFGVIEVFTWVEQGSSCSGTFSLQGGQSSCGGDDHAGPALGYGESSFGGPFRSNASVENVPPDAEWVVFTTTAGWRVLTDAIGMLAYAEWPADEGALELATAYDAELNEIWSESR
ncbi:MAG: hypothetical protein KJO18_04140, partial [Acidimicrobiia bacterium]|nr:hypothetical protein [Acidimicrobiia bacterium]